MDTRYSKRIDECQDTVLYDQDSSPMAWEHYRHIYTGHWDLFESFGTSDEELVYMGNAYKRCIAVAPQAVDDVLCYSFKIGGDVDFNFNCHDKFLKFFNIIEKCEDEVQRNALAYQLLRCHKSHCTLKNFSIMAVTGGMNNIKGSHKLNKHPEDACHFDRYDRFIYLLNQFFIGNLEVVGVFKSYKASTGKYLVDFLNSFKRNNIKNAIYNYCKEIYFIENKEFVDEIIENGNQPINKGVHVKRYMDLAEKYWEIREKIFIGIY